MSTYVYNTTNKETSKGSDYYTIVSALKVFSTTLENILFTIYRKKNKIGGWSIAYSEHLTSIEAEPVVQGYIEDGWEVVELTVGETLRAIKTIYPFKSVFCNEYLTPSSVENEFAVLPIFSRDKGLTGVFIDTGKKGEDTMTLFKNLLRDKGSQHISVHSFLGESGRSTLELKIIETPLAASIIVLGHKVIGKEPEVDKSAEIAAMAVIDQFQSFTISKQSIEEKSDVATTIGKLLNYLHQRHSVKLFCKTTQDTITFVYFYPETFDSGWLSILKAAGFSAESLPTIPMLHEEMSWHSLLDARLFSTEKEDHFYTLIPYTSFTGDIQVVMASVGKLEGDKTYLRNKHICYAELVNNVDPVTRTFDKELLSYNGVDEHLFTFTYQESGKYVVTSIRKLTKPNLTKLFSKFKNVFKNN